MRRCEHVEVEGVEVVEEVEVEPVSLLLADDLASDDVDDDACSRALFPTFAQTLFPVTRRGKGSVVIHCALERFGVRAAKVA